jgi:adenine phosphoribosyltransferase
VDITTLLGDGDAFATAIDALAARYRGRGVTHVVACEARGFLIASALAYALRLPLVPIRKKHKLPADTLAVEVREEDG